MWTIFHMTNFHSMNKCCHVSYSAEGGSCRSNWIPMEKQRPAYVPHLINSLLQAFVDPMQSNERLGISLFAQNNIIFLNRDTEIILICKLLMQNEKPILKIHHLDEKWHLYTRIVGVSKQQYDQIYFNNRNSNMKLMSLFGYMICLGVHIQQTLKTPAKSASIFVIDGIFHVKSQKKPNPRRCMEQCSKRAWDGSLICTLFQVASIVFCV